MRQLNRYLMRRNGIPFGRGVKKIVASYTKNGRRYELHATKGWRSYRIRTEPEVLSINTGTN